MSSVPPPVSEPRWLAGMVGRDPARSRVQAGGPRSLLPLPPPPWFPCSGQPGAGVSAPAAGAGGSAARAELAASLAAPHQRGVRIQLLRGLGGKERGGQPGELILGLKKGEDDLVLSSP